MDTTHAVGQGTLSGRLGDSATAAEAELFDIIAILRKVQAQQILGYYGHVNGQGFNYVGLSLRTKNNREGMEGEKNTYRGLQNGAVLEAIITNVRENLGT
eukprot:3072616-Pleurochrysis_carterae.AAC.1